MGGSLAKRNSGQNWEILRAVEKCARVHFENQLTVRGGYAWELNTLFEVPKIFQAEYNCTHIALSVLPSYVCM
jgi:hypothetical protein